MCGYGVAVDRNSATCFFGKKIPQAEQKHFASCGSCFDRFILSYVNNETQWRQRWLLIAQFSARNHLFYASSKSLCKYNATNIYWRAKYILLLLNWLRKPTLKGKNNSTHLIQWMKEDFYCLLFPFEVSTVLFGTNVLFHGKNWCTKT